MFLSLLLLLSSPAFADDPGNFTILGSGEPAPFEGVLLDIDATATILTLPNFLENRFELDCDYKIGQLTAEHELQLSQLNIRLDSITHEYNTAITQKDLEIAHLQETLASTSSKNPWVWGVIGAVVGAGLTVGIVNAVDR